MNRRVGRTGCTRGNKAAGHSPPPGLSRHVIVIERAFVALCAGLSESVTLTVKGKVPEDVGVPEITPVEELRTSPGGKEPALIDHVYGLFPPAAVSVAEYDVLTLP